MSEKSLEQSERLELVANLHIQGVPQAQIGECVGLSQASISEIMQTDAFRSMLAVKQAEHYEKSKQYDDGWDAVENKALANLINGLAINPNPELALKAAVLANKAHRRVSPANRPLQATEAGARVFIQLNQTFAEQLQTIGLKVISQGEMKVASVLSPTRVEKFIEQVPPPPTAQQMLASLEVLEAAE